MILPCTFRTWILLIVITAAALLAAPLAVTAYVRHDQTPISYTLTDQGGKAFHSAMLDKPKLIFFGFTSCPDICPTTLQRMKQVKDGLAAAQLDVVPIFISVDPARDTPQVLKDYLASFDPDFIGLTGTETEIDAVMGRFGAIAKKVNDDNASDYLFNHSSMAYFADGNDVILDVLEHELTAEQMITRLKAAWPDHPQEAALKSKGKTL